MQTSFERSKRAIDALIPVAKELVDGDHEKMIRKRLRGLSQAYGAGLLSQHRAPVDYTKTTTHIAYLYRVFAAHAEWTYKALASNHIAVGKILSATDPIKVACLGGGPGSDMAGVLKFALKYGLSERDFRFCILDRERSWGRCRGEVLDTFNGEVEASQKFQNLDVTADSDWTDDWRFTEASIFTMSFFLSEVWSFNGDGSVSRFLQEVIDKAQSGSLFVYTDNGGEQFSPLAEAEFDRSDISLVEGYDDERIFLGSDEQKDILVDAYGDIMKQSPKLTANLAWRIWKKE